LGRRTGAHHEDCCYVPGYNWLNYNHIYAPLYSVSHLQISKIWLSFFLSQKELLASGISLNILHFNLHLQNCWTK
jgi:hypothetical protein